MSRRLGREERGRALNDTTAAAQGGWGWLRRLGRAVSVLLLAPDRDVACHSTGRRVARRPRLQPFPVPALAAPDRSQIRFRQATLHAPHTAPGPALPEHERRGCARGGAAPRLGRRSVRRKRRSGVICRGVAAQPRRGGGHQRVPIAFHRTREPRARGPPRGRAGRGPWPRPWRSGQPACA